MQACRKKRYPRVEHYDLETATMEAAFDQAARDVNLTDAKFSMRRVNCRPDG